MSYEVVVVQDRTELRAVLPEWQDLLTRSPRSCGVFNDPTIVEFSVSQGAVLPHIVLIRRGGVLECVSPFRIQPSHFRLQFSVFQLASLPVRLMTLFGNDFVYAENADVAHCCSLVFDALHRDDFDLSILNAIDTESRLWQYCAAANGQPRGLRLVRSNRRTDKSFDLELPKNFAEYLASLGSNTRGSLKRRTKNLLADHSGKLIKVVSVDQVRLFLDDVDVIFRDSWQSKTYGEVKRNHDAEIARLEHVARQGWLSSYLLTSDLGPLAFQIGYRYGDKYYACDFAFARRFSSLGPGATLMYLMLEDLFRVDPPRVVDFRDGDSPQKRTFRGVPHDVGDFYAIPSNRWRHFVNAQRGLSEIESIVRTALVQMRLDDVLRRILKHKQ